MAAKKIFGNFWWKNVAICMGFGVLVGMAPKVLVKNVCSIQVMVAKGANFGVEAQLVAVQKLRLGGLLFLEKVGKMLAWCKKVVSSGEKWPDEGIPDCCRERKAR